MNLTVKEIAVALNINVRSVQRRAAKEAWSFETKLNRGGLQRQYPLKSLPKDVNTIIVETLKSGVSENFGEVSSSFSFPESTAAAGGTISPPAVKINNDQPLDFHLASAQGQEKARQWSRIITYYIEGDESAVTSSKTARLDHFVASFNAGLIDAELRKESGSISKRTLYRKVKAFKDGGVEGCLAALLPNYKGRERDIHPDVEKKAVAYFLERPRKIRRIYEYLKSDFAPELIPSYAALRRFINAWAEDHQSEIVLAHWGENKWKKKFLAAFGSASEDAPYPNHTWEIDSTVADLMTKDGKRWKLVAIIDVHSRLCPSITIQKENDSWGVVQTLARGFHKYGIPERLRKDNGKDYASRHVSGFLRGLGIDVPKLAIKAPERKPHVERFFRDVSSRFLSELTGYTGNSLLNRPEKIKLNYTVEELDKVLQQWVEHEFNELAPSTTGQIRRERFFAPGFRMRKVSKEELDILVHPTYHGKRVGKKGITFENKNYCAPELVGLIGKKVTFRLDVNDISHVMVFLKDKFFCHAYDRTAATWSMDKYHAEKKTYKRALKQSIKAEKELARGGVKDRMLAHLNEKEEKTPLRFRNSEDIVNVIDLSQIKAREIELETPDHGTTPYDAFPDQVKDLPFYEAWQNYEYLCKAEALGIPIDAVLTKWKEDWMHDRIEGLEGEWWNLYGKHEGNSDTAIPLFAEVARLKNIANGE